MSFNKAPRICVALTALVACGGPDDKNTSASTSSTTPMTDAGTQGASTSTSAAATSSAATTDSTGATATSTATTGATTGPTSGDTDTTGGACSKQTEPCNAGQQCCDGLTCCAGVPVPRGEEFCSDNCPISDRNAKTDLRPVDAGEVLSRVVALDITSWRYKHDGAEVRHLGPMAQDFRAAFGLWNTDRMIFPLDAAGVSLAAIQGLHRRLVAAEADNDELRARLDRLERRLAALSPAAP